MGDIQLVDERLDFHAGLPGARLVSGVFHLFANSSVFGSPFISPHVKLKQLVGQPFPFLRGEVMEPMEGEIFPGMGVIHGKDGEFPFLFGNPYLFVVLLLDALEEIVRERENGIQSLQRNVARRTCVPGSDNFWIGR